MSKFSLFIFTILFFAENVRTASYGLSQSYVGNNLVNGFNFFTAKDPSGGWVTYVNQTTAQNSKYVVVSSGVVYIGVDTSRVLNPSGPGRQAVRLVSQKSFEHGLFIADFEHMPGGICGVWPAFWMVGPNWPAGGEIDIVEGVNTGNQNTMTAHTASGCSTNGAGMQATLVRSNCNDGQSASNPTNGCAMVDTNTNSYGQNFNSNSGGVWATQWTSNNISIYFFPRSKVPSDITNGNPNPSNWGTPDSLISSECAIDNYFSNMQMVIDTDFCGGWADGLWQSSGCSTHASTCESYVANNPGAFNNAYWAINSINVYQPKNSNEANRAPIRRPTKTQTPLASVSSVGQVGLAMGAPSPTGQTT